MRKIKFLLCIILAGLLFSCGKNNLQLTETKTSTVSERQENPDLIGKLAEKIKDAFN